jgi:type I restriction enzyme S subunit
LGLRYRLEEVVDFNPKERLLKGTIAKKVPMEKVQAYSRDINGYDLEPYNGGAKFRNGDTIMARITPCLENGKSAYISFLDDDEVGYGSTEFIVWRAKDGITDSEYIYYLSQSPEIKDVAVKSMVGSSGRQRVQQGVLNAYEITLPPLVEQKKIADTLSALDAKIAANKAINHRLEQMAQAIFKSWFVDFEPFGGVMPEDWREGTLGSISIITSGKRPPLRESVASAEVDIPLIGASSIMGYTNAVLYNEKIFVTGRVGTHGVIQRYSRPCWASDNTLVIKSNFYEFVYQQLCTVDFRNMNRGSTQPLITQTDLQNAPIILPNEKSLHKFEELVGSLMLRYENNILENKTLAETRDNLLPHLMSGELSLTDFGKDK